MVWGSPCCLLFFLLSSPLFFHLIISPCCSLKNALIPDINCSFCT
ncbi:hypothetical protein GLYMA_04G022580v4 [Glycine max]|nr:hypothetical protein GLYMA_04G022580v4 [Glycine max]KAH1109411.1 hypothetical protein GYH30_008694 [Glycine max]